MPLLLKRKSFLHCGTIDLLEEMVFHPAVKVTRAKIQTIAKK
jgi:hypothetical protein